MKKVAVICVDYQTPEYTYKLVDSINTQFEIDKFSVSIELIIINNSINLNDANNFKFLKDFKFTTLMSPGTNLGYFHGLNYALDNMNPSKFDFIVIGNNDLIYKNDFIKTLLTTIYPSDCMVICPDVLTIDNKHQNPHHLDKLSKFRLFLFDLYFFNYYVAIFLTHLNKLIRRIKEPPKFIKKSRLYEIHQGVGACYVLTPLFFKNNSRLFFPGFLYGEEACLSYQVHSSGGRLYFDDNLLVEHAESASLSKLPKKINYQYGKSSYWKFRHIFKYYD